MGGAHSERKRALSELEGCVLGRLWKNGASTPYAVRRMFQISRSSHWSGSAGAVYPALARLEQRGLVDSVRAQQGARPARRYSLTPAGRRTFLTWLEPPFAADVLSVPPDPLRTRMSFLAALSPAQRAAFIAASIAGLRRHAKTLGSRAEDDEDEREVHAAAQFLMQARIDWCKRMQRHRRQPSDANRS